MKTPVQDYVRSLLYLEVSPGGGAWRSGTTEGLQDDFPTA